MHSEKNQMEYLVNTLEKSKKRLQNKGGWKGHIDCYPNSSPYRIDRSRKTLKQKIYKQWRSVGLQYGDSEKRFFGVCTRQDHRQWMLVEARSKYADKQKLERTIWPMHLTSLEER